METGNVDPRHDDSPSKGECRFWNEYLKQMANATTLDHLNMVKLKGGLLRHEEKFRGIVFSSDQDDWELVRKVRRGKCSEVFEGLHCNDDERCIIKLLKPAIQNTSQETESLSQ